MNTQLQPIEYSKQRILSSEQLAEAYGTDVNNITVNFNRNKDRYTEGKHYFFLEGEALQNFLRTLQFVMSGKEVNKIKKLYLWTEKGAFMHAKSLNTDRAWEAYEKLVDGYYRALDLIKRQAQPLAEDRETRRLVASLRRDIREIQNILTQPNNARPHISRQELEQRIIDAVQGWQEEYPEGMTIHEMQFGDTWLAVYAQRYRDETLFMYAEKLVDRGMLHRNIAKQGYHLYTIPE